MPGNKSGATSQRAGGCGASTDGGFVMADDLFEGREWFVVVAKTGRMKEARDRLSEQGYGAYAPMVLTRRVIDGQVEDVERPMLGRYFVVGLLSWQPIGPVKNTRGVAYLAHDGGGRPLRIGRGDLRKLKARCDADGGALDLRPAQARTEPMRERVDWQPNQLLQVIEGPFAELTATLLRLDGNHAVAQVLVDIFGRPTPVEIPVAALRSVGAAMASAG